MYIIQIYLLKIYENDDFYSFIADDCHPKNQMCV